MLGHAITALAPRVPLLLIAGERDNPSKDAVQSVRQNRAASRLNKVELFPSSLHGYKLLRLEPKVTSALFHFLETTLKNRPVEWEPQYNLTPVTFGDTQLVQNTKQADNAKNKAKAATLPHTREEGRGCPEAKGRKGRAEAAAEGTSATGTPARASKLKTTDQLSAAQAPEALRFLPIALFPNLKCSLESSKAYDSCRRLHRVVFRRRFTCSMAKVLCTDPGEPVPMTYLSEDPTYLAGALLLLAGAFLIALNVTQQGKYLISAGIAFGMALAVVLIEWMWVTDNERIEIVVYDVRTAVLKSDAEAVIAHLAPKAMYLQGDTALSPDATRALIRNNVSRVRLEFARISELQTSVGQQSRRGKAEFRVFTRGSLKTSSDITDGDRAVMTSWSLGFQETEPGVWKITRISPLSIPRGILALPGRFDSLGRVSYRPERRHRRPQGSKPFNLSPTPGAGGRLQTSRQHKGHFPRTLDRGRGRRRDVRYCPTLPPRRTDPLRRTARPFGVADSVELRALFAVRVLENDELVLLLVVAIILIRRKLGQGDIVRLDDLGHEFVIGPWGSGHCRRGTGRGRAGSRAGKPGR